MLHDDFDEDERLAFQVARKRRGLASTDGEPSETVDNAVMEIAQHVRELAGMLTPDPAALRWLASVLESHTAAVDAEASRAR